MSSKHDQRVAKRKRRRITRRAKRRIRTSSGFTRILKLIVGTYMKVKFKARAVNTELFRSVRPPFVVLPNHSCVLDPFMINAFVPGQIQYVVSDSNFRSPVVNFGLGLVGSIPKTKVMSDLDTVRQIMKVKDKGGVIGIYPEGQNTWDGHSLPMYYSTAKLVKLLKIPVVAVRVQGAFLSKPRWSRRPRRGAVTIRFSLAFRPEEIKSTSAEEIDRRIADLISHDEYVANRADRVKFIGRDRAEYIEQALFICPACTTLGSLRSHGNDLACTECGYAVHYDLYGFFRPRVGELCFDNMHDWNLWQTEELGRKIEALRESGRDGPIFSEPEARIEIGYKDLPLELYATGGVDLHLDRVVFRPQDAPSESIPLATVAGTNIQNNERLEFYGGSDLFRITLADRRGSTFKWEVAIRQIQAATDAVAK